MSRAAFLPAIRQSGASAVAGPTLSVDPIVAALSVMSYQDDGMPMPRLIVRKETKRHGGRRAIEGRLVPGSQVAVVDDACSTGSGLFHAIEAVNDAGCVMVKVLTMDRQASGRQRGVSAARLSLPRPAGSGYRRECPAHWRGIEVWHWT